MALYYFLFLAHVSKEKQKIPDILVLRIKYLAINAFLLFIIFVFKMEGYMMAFNRVCEITSGDKDFDIQYSEPIVRRFTLKE